MKKSLILCVFACVACTGISFAGNLQSLHPKPKASFLRSGSFTLVKSTPLVIPDAPSASTKAGVALLQKYVKAAIGDTLVVTKASQFPGGGGVIIGEANSNAWIASTLPNALPSGEKMPGAQGYILDITTARILIAGADTDGTFNAVSTFAQLLNPSGASAKLDGVHIWDEPDFPLRWVFLPKNIQSPTAFAELKVISDTMANLKLNGAYNADFKFDILRYVPSFYFDSLASWKKIAADRNIEIIPGVANIGYSSGILYNDPNLATGMQTSATYIMEADTGRLIPDPTVTLPNGNFESLSNNQFTGWSFYDGAGMSVFPDNTIFHGGATSARCTNFVQGNPSGNCRFERTMNCKPNHYYTMSAWLKTNNYSGTAQLLAIGQDNSGQNSRQLTYTSYSIPSTTNAGQNGGWMKVEVRFNTLSNTKLLLYCGTWGGTQGTIWWDDFQVQEAGMCNILRRAGTPLHIKNQNTGAEYNEGVDFQPISDAKLNASHGDYGVYHTPPPIRRINAGAMRNGDTLTATFSHPMTTVSDANVNGSTMVSLSEDTLYQLMTFQAQTLKNLLSPKRFFMGHDEIRCMNWDSGDLKRNLSPRGLLGDNIKRCDSIFKNIGGSEERVIWSDMIDTFHNAVNNYYLLNGDLRGIWNDIPKSLIVANWNYGNRDASLKFFSKLGLRQISSPYYDVGNTSTIRGWRISQDTIAGMLGSVYTTWNNDYTFLRAFADYFWSAGPFVIHTPLDTSVLAKTTLDFSAQVFPDPYDPADKITSVIAEIYDSLGVRKQTVTLASSGSLFTGTTNNTYKSGFRYRIIAVNSQGLKRVGPMYEIKGAAPNQSVNDNEYSSFAIRVFPNPIPAKSSATIEFTSAERSEVNITLINILGETLSKLYSGNADANKQTVTLDTKNLSVGTYFIRLESKITTKTVKFVVE